MAQIHAPLPTSTPPPVTASDVTGSASDGGDAGTLGQLSSLYVGDLDASVTDLHLENHFNQAGQVVSVRVCRDTTTGLSLGYGYVNYSNDDDAERALQKLNFSSLNDKPIRIMHVTRDASVRKSGVGNIFVKNLDKTIDKKVLHDTFSEFGNILSCKIVTDCYGQSKGHGFVQFDNEESAKNAINKLNGILLNDKQVFVGPFLRKEEREFVVDKTKFNNVYVKNLSESTTVDDLKKFFGEYGNITSAVVMRDGDGKSRCFGFVNFENHEDAAHSVEALNGKMFGDKELYVGKAQKKSERELELRSRFEQSLREAAERFELSNLYVKNIDETITDEMLHELFSEHGTVTSCKVTRDPNGASKGSGFVAFSNVGEASRALIQMNGKFVGKKPLYVAHAQRKEDRRARLEAQFSQMRPAMLPSMGPRMPFYPPGAPGIGKHFFYPQGPPSMIPPQRGYGFPLPMVPGVGPNFFAPMMQPGQHGRGPAGRRIGGEPMRPSQLPMPIMHPQMLPRGRGGYHNRPGRNTRDGSRPVMMPPVQAFDTAGIPFSQPLTAVALSSALANSTPAQQRTLLGEHLYPLVFKIEHENAAKVTGMLLEMDQTEVLHLLESPEALKAKVAEAMEVLGNIGLQTQAQVSKGSGTDGTPADDAMASLSISEKVASSS